MTRVNTIRVTRATTESKMVIIIENGPRDPQARYQLKTPLPFFNHMLEHVAWRSQLNITVEVELDRFELAHLVTEDVGIALGKAVKEYIDRNVAQGIVGYGSAFGVIDEALSRAVMSFESRAYLDFSRNDVVLPEHMEGMHSEDLVAFFEGYVQGAQCTLHLDLLKGRTSHGHHIWESAFRAFGMALYEVLQERAWRSEMTAGVAGKIDFIVESQS